MDAAEHIAEALRLLGLDGDPELARTGPQFADLLAEHVPATPPEVAVLQTTSHDLVVVRGLPFHSLCAHHLVPFFGTCDVGYRPDGRIAGLGSFPRLLTAFSRRPQLQERLAAQLADHLVQALSPRALAIRIEARQMCMEMRGARSAGLVTVLARRGLPDAALEEAIRA